MKYSTEKYREYRNRFMEKEGNKERYKEYFKEYNPKYYGEHKEELLRRAGEKLLCDCGCMVRKDHMNKHKKTQKHEKKLNKLSRELVTENC